MDPQLKKEPLGNGFEIYVSEHHTFGTDAVLLADFAAAKKSDRLVDLGTGCGIIPFLILRDGMLQNAVGVDISKEATDLALMTARELSLERFSAVCGDIKDLKGKTEFGRATLVTCNPPYKSPDGGIKNLDPIEAAARHETLCTLEDIVSTASRLLQTSGRLCMCHRPERLAELIGLMSKYGVEAKRLRLVCKTVGSEPWLVLVEGRKCGKVGMRVAPTLYMYENGEYTEEILKIYGPYKEGHI